MTIGWVQHSVGQALNELTLVRQTAAHPDGGLPEKLSKVLITAIDSLRSLMPAPTGYVMRAGSCGLMRRVECATLEGAQESAKQNTESGDWEYVIIQAEADGLRWTVEVWK